VAIPAVVLLAPLFAILAILIKLDSSGPVFFRQIRVGRWRQKFVMWKFRKMPHSPAADGPSLTRRYDLRLTGVGRFLERTKLDELPQLFNVLLGDMSVVGPRPEVPKFVHYYPEQWDKVLSVKPGLMGPCQVRFRNESELFPVGCKDVEGYYVRHILPEKLEIDAQYAGSFSVASDLHCLARASFAALGGTVTRQTLLNRRWQILNTLILSFLGVAMTLASLNAAGRQVRPETAFWLLVFSALIKPLCIIAFRIPKALATSVSADDLLRICWCAGVSGSLLSCAMLFADYRNMGRAVLLADTSAFLAALVLYKLICYSVYVCFFLQKSRELSRRLTLAALVLGPLSMTIVLFGRHGIHGWESLRSAGWPALAFLALVIRPVIVLLKPLRLQAVGISWLASEGVKLFLGALVGSSLIVSGSLVFQQSAIGRLDIVCDCLLYLFLMTGVALWHVSPHRQLELTSSSGNNGAESHERLLIIGGGVELGIYMGALSALPEHDFKIVGAVSPRSGDRTNMVGGISLLGEVADAPELVKALNVTRLLVIDPSVDDDAMDDLCAECALDPGQVSRIEQLSPFLHWPKDLSEDPFEEPIDDGAVVDQ
jgi:lipopolysaccharide/colanic/teichoic acid biosynthesis glycosyltransferase